jgi:hypothetical protein
MVTLYVILFSAGLGWLIWRASPPHLRGDDE